MSKNTTKKSSSGTVIAVLSICLIIAVAVIACIVIFDTNTSKEETLLKETRENIQNAETLYDRAVELLTEKEAEAEAKLNETETTYNNAIKQVELAEGEYATAKNKLSEAEKAYNSAVFEIKSAKVDTQNSKNNFADAQTEYSKAKLEVQKAELKLNEAKDCLAKAESEYKIAQGKLEDAKAELATAKSIYEEAKNTYNFAEYCMQQAENSYQASTQKSDEAKGNYNKAKAEYEKAVETYNETLRAIAETGSVTVVNLKPTAQEIYQKISPSVVEIRKYNGQDAWVSVGSGFFISQDGKVVTNYHVISNAISAEIYIDDEHIYPVQSVLGYDVDLDIAVLKIDKTDCVPVTIATTEPAPGDTIYSLGSNLGITGTYATGIVSDVEKYIEEYDATKYIHYYGISNSGNSGCAIFNEDGEVIGIHQLGDAATGNHGFAIPIRELSKIEQTNDDTILEVTKDNALDLTEYVSYYTNFTTTITITGFKEAIPSTISAVIPGTIEGKKVTEIRWGSIGSIYLEDVQQIFVDENIKFIGEGVFEYCDYLTYLSLPSTLNTLSEKAFGLNPYFYQVNIEGIYYIIEDGVLYDSTKTVLYRYLGCNSDEENEDRYKTEFTAPESVDLVAPYAFFNAQGVETIKLGSNVKTIGEFAFGNCIKLTSINIPEGVTNIGIGAFYFDESIKELIIPSSVISIGDILKNNESGYIYVGAFYAMTGLTSVTFAEGFAPTKIGDATFGLCTSLKTVTNYQSATATGTGVFVSCIALKGMDLSSTTMTSLAKSFFKNCYALETVVLPETLETLGEGCFYYCENLKTINIPSQITEIPDYAFVYCSKLSTIALPDNITKIGYASFAYCEKLTDLDLQNTSITLLDDYAFCECNSLATIEFSDTLTTIGEYCFADCDKLTSLVLPKNLRRIKQFAFMACEKLALVNASAVTRPPYLDDCDIFGDIYEKDIFIVIINEEIRAQFEANDEWYYLLAFGE